MYFAVSRRALVAAAVLVVSGHVFGATAGILFDATKAEMAGSADWVVDADTRTLGVVNGKMVAGQGTESNPQITPTPAQSGITSSTSETYWAGALSSWGVDAAKRGFNVQTLPYNGAITYGNSTNAQDLSNYSVYVIDEPNILFTAAEKTAIVTYVKNGGGLIMISDHNGSDRNNDGSDSVDVWNDLFINNTVQKNPFGITYNSDSLSATSTYVDTASTNALTRGKAGNVTSFAYNGGATMTLSTTDNASVKGAVWQTSTKSSSTVMAAYATFGSGRVVAVGDSSPADDGTGDPNDSLYAGWTTASDAALFENATLFASGSTTANAPTVPEPAMLSGLFLAGGLLLKRHRVSRA